MYATIRLSPYIYIQGRVIRELPDGAIAVEISGREVVGKAVASSAAAVSEAMRHAH